MKRYALVIGIAGYKDKGLNNLEKPPIDAEAVAQILEKHGDFQEVKRLPENWISRNCCEVGSTELTGEVLTDTLRNFLLEQAVNSEALIYFSGHGISVFDKLDEEKEGFLATSDCKIEFEGKRIISQQKGISLRSLNKLIEKSQVSSLVQVCYNQLHNSPVFKNPQTDVEKQACETCQKYVWSREDLTNSSR